MSGAGASHPAAIRYAAYGSNLHPGRLMRRLPAARLLGTAFVPSRSLVFHKRSVDGSGKCCLASPGDGVHVAVYAFDGASKALLDDIEGVGRGYAARRLDVPGFGSCYTYEADPDYLDPSLSPYDWYRDLVLIGCRALGLPRDYVRHIEATACIEDPDRERAAANRALADALRAEAVPAPGALPVAPSLP